MKRLLVGSDGSEHARGAAELAYAVARETGGTVTLLRVGRGGAWEAVDGVRGGRVPVEMRRADGDPADVLVRLAERERFDVLVVGYRGRGALAEALLGSTTKRVLERARCPVLVARGRAPARIRRIVVAVDDSAEARRAVEAGASLARGCRAALTLLHVVDTEVLARAPRAESMLRLHAGQDGTGKLSLLWASQLCDRVGVEAELVQVRGPAAQAILDQAVRRAADVVAIGRDRGGPEPFSLGRVSDEVMRQARTALLVAGPETLGIPAGAVGESGSAGADVVGAAAGPGLWRWR